MSNRRKRGTWCLLALRTALQSLSILRSPSRVSFDCDSDLSAGMTGFEIRIRGGGFSKRIGFGESGHDLSAFRQIAQNAEVLFVNVDAKHDKLLLRKFRTKGGGKCASHIEQGLFVHS